MAAGGGATIHPHGRNREKLGEAVREIAAATGNDRLHPHLAGFLLTLRLLPLLERSAPSRIVNVASIGQAPIDFDDPMIERSYEGKRAYSQSKLAQISFGFELADRLRDSGVTVNSLHPSTLMPTTMVLQQYGQSIDTLEGGIEATARLAVAPELEGVSGRFFDRQDEAVAHPQAYDPEARRRRAARRR